MTTTTSAHSADDAAPGRPAAGGLSRWQKAIGILGLVVVFWVGDRLYTVVDRGGMGPGMDHGPGGGTPTTQPTGGDNPTPGGGDTGGHDPSQFDHG
jgi:hypothetical protein